MVIFKYFLFWVLLGLERESSNFSTSFYIYSFNLLNMPYIEFIIAFYSHIPLDVHCFFQVENEYHGMEVFFILCENIIVLKIFS